MIPVLSRDQIRKFDEHAVQTCHVPSLVLMENAGRGAADWLSSRLAPGARVLVLCGPGNNGGDGFVLARRLMVLGTRAHVALVSPAAKLKGDARANHDAWLGIGGAVEELGDQAAERLASLLAGVDVVVDALFGTGLDRPLRANAAQLVTCLNDAELTRIALDIPSGVDADSGAVLGAAVRAHATLTFAHPKLGLCTTSGLSHSGELVVVDIGVPPELFHAVGHSAEISEASDVAALLGRRRIETHKGSAGRVVALAGSAGKTGAALLVARGALRGGAGLVTLAAFAETAAALDQRVLEAMTARVDPDDLAGSLEQLLCGAAAVAIGPGLGLDAKAKALVDHVVLNVPGKIIVDADALTQFAGRAELLAEAAGELLLTPHSGEAARLLETTPDAVEADRFAALARLVELSQATVLLKGPRTLIGAPGQLPVVNVSGSPALATGGAGDVLTGLCAAFACQVDLRSAGIAAAYLHGRAAELWVAEQGGDRGLCAHEVADRVPAALAALANGGGLLPD